MSKKQLIYKWLWPFEKLVILAVAISVVLIFVFSFHICNGSSMYPTISDGDMCLFYRQDTPVRGDIVSYKTPSGMKIGRAVGIAGDRVSIDHEKLYVNGYEQESFYTVPGNVAEHTVKSGEIFVVNDYRTDTSDSRKYGDVSLKNVEGVYFASLRTGGVS